MIASYSHNFIFLKTRKSAGTSVEIVLSAWCRDNDICTYITPEDEILRLAFGGSARNFTADLTLERSYVSAAREGNVATMYSLLPELERRSQFYNHMPAAAVKRLLPDLWHRAFKFAVERHPYEKAVSRAWWDVSRIHGGNPKTFAIALDQVIEERRFLDTDIYLVNGQLAVDKLIKYDELWEKLAEFAEQWGVQMPPDPPQAKSTFRGDRRSAFETLSDAQKRKIYEAARFEFELLGFER